MAHTSQPTDIMELIDRLAAQVTDGKRVLLSNRIMVEEGEFFSLLDELRQAIPGEIHQARRVLQDRQKVILDAQEEAQKILATAKDRAEYLISEKGLTNEARYRSEDYLRQSRDNVRRSMSEVDDFARRILGDVDEVLRKNLEVIERARGSLEQHD